MRRASFLRRLCAFALVTGAIVAPIAPAAADHSAGWHWQRSANPFVVRVVDSVTSAWQSPVEAAAIEWSERSSVLNISVASGASDAATRNECPAPDGAVRICNADYGDKPWAARTRVVMIGNHIVRAKIKLNDEGAFALRALACHEIGHALGLGHRDSGETSSCMTPTVARSQKHPDAHDLRQLRRIYEHGDGSSAQTADVHAHDSDDEHVRVVHRGPYTIVTVSSPATRR